MGLYTLHKPLRLANTAHRIRCGGHTIPCYLCFSQDKLCVLTFNFRFRHLWQALEGLPQYTI